MSGRGGKTRVCDARGQYIRWLLLARDFSSHTIRAYDGDIVALERHLGVRAWVEQIDRDCLLGFIEQQRAAGLAATSLKRRASGLRGFCKWLLSRRMLPADPWVGTSVALGRSRRLPRVLMRHELDQLVLFLCRAADHNKAGDAGRTLRNPHACTTLLAVALMVATGVRVHEAVGLRCEDIDLPGRSLRLLGKGRRERQVFLTNDWMADLIHAYLLTREALGVGHSYLLFNQRHEPMTDATLRLRLVEAARAAGLSRRVTPHMLRHTAATQLIEAGVDIRYIQRLLGHASLSTTEIYTHVSDRALKQVVSDADVLGCVLELR
jgi:site-specific recombinase XerD